MADSHDCKVVFCPILSQSMIVPVSMIGGVLVSKNDQLTVQFCPVPCLGEKCLAWNDRKCSLIQGVTLEADGCLSSDP